MNKQTEALNLALEALENNRKTHYYCEDTWYSCPKHEEGCANESEGDECNCGADEANAEIDKAISAIKEALAQPEQKTLAWKLVPIKPTEEMLKAMDECSTEGYDERLYAGHAASVYMAAVDVAPVLPQQCYCGDITRLGVVHRADSFCDEKPEQEPVAVKHMMEWVDYLKRKSDYGQHLQIPSEMSAGACWDLARELEQFITTPPQPQSEARGLSQSKPLTFDEIEGCFPDGGGTNEYGEAVVSAQWLHDFAAAVQRAAHGIKE